MIPTRIVALASGVLAATGLVVLACGDPYGAEALTEAPDAAPIADGGARDVEAEADATTRTCPSTAGSIMLQIHRPADAGSYCIDATEVTQAQYQAFLKTFRGTKVAGCEQTTLASECDFSATEFAPQTRPAFPVSCVDWCDAVTFCQSSGKRLCGTFADVSPDAGVDLRSEWFGACSAFGEQPYPWGQESARDAGRCNEGTDAAAAVASTATCQGAPSGLFDMIGNLREWEGVCNDQGFCTARGGGFGDVEAPADDHDSLHCNWPFGVPKSMRDRLLGFRCCADLR